MSATAERQLNAFWMAASHFTAIFQKRLNHLEVVNNNIVRGFVMSKIIWALKFLFWSQSAVFGNDDFVLKNISY